MKSKLLTIGLFWVLNFLALGIGAWWMGSPAENEWYQAANKAPWTPPGWVFGVAWFSIMVFFSIFMGLIWTRYPERQKQLGWMFAIQWVLNVGWNPVFFVHHWVFLGGIMIILLAVVVFWFLIKGFQSPQKTIGLLVLPYATWLVIATSLNWFIALAN